MITLKLKYSLDDIQDRNLIHSYMNQYNHVFRVAYNKFNDGLKTSQKELSNLNNISLLDSWFISSAMNQANALHKANQDKNVIFGGKKNFFDRLKGNISKEQFNLKRLNPLCSIVL